MEENKQSANSGKEMTTNNKSREAFTHEYCVWYLEYYNKPPVWEDHIDFTRYVAFKAGAVQQHQEPRETSLDEDKLRAALMTIGHLGDGAPKLQHEWVRIGRNAIGIARNVMGEWKLQVKAERKAIQPIPTEVKQTDGDVVEREKCEECGENFITAHGQSKCIACITDKTGLRGPWRYKLDYEAFGRAWEAWLYNADVSKMDRDSALKGAIAVYLKALQHPAEPAQPNIEEVVKLIRDTLYFYDRTDSLVRPLEDVIGEALSRAGYLKGEK